MGRELMSTPNTSAPSKRWPPRTVGSSPSGPRRYPVVFGFFAGPRIEPFDHAVVTAYFWPIEAMTRELARAGLEIIDTHARTDPGSRPHGAILARREGAMTDGDE